MSTISAYLGDGFTTQFDITFSYEGASTVKVRLDGVDAPSYTFVNPSRVELPTAPATGVLVEVYRKTDVSAPVVTFEDGAIIREVDLNSAVGQTRRRTEELESELEARLPYVGGAPANAAFVSHASEHGATRTVNKVLDDAPWLDSFPGADYTAKFRAIETAQPSVVHLPPKLVEVDFGTTPFTPTAPITLRGHGGRDGPDVYNNSNCAFLQTTEWGPAGPISVSAQGFQLRGNTAKPNGAGMDIYDNGNAKIADLVIKQFNKSALRFKYGVNLDLDNLRIVGVNGQPAPVVEITGDNASVANGALLKNVYITGGGTAFRFNRARDIKLIACTAEYYDTLGLDGENGSGWAHGLYLENDSSLPGNNPGRTMDFVFNRQDVGWTYGTWSTLWSGVGGSERMLGTDYRLVGTAYRTTTLSGMTDNTWTALPMTNTGVGFFTALSGGRLRVDRPGLVSITYNVEMAETGGSAQRGAARAKLFVGGAGAGVEIVGSSANKRLAAAASATLTKTFMLQVAAGDEIGLEVGVSNGNVWVYQDTAGSGAGGAGEIPAPTTAITADIAVSWLGLSTI